MSIKSLLAKIIDMMIIKEMVQLKCVIRYIMDEWISTLCMSGHRNGQFSGPRVGYMLAGRVISSLHKIPRLLI